jgi:hypothetical protein
MSSSCCTSLRGGEKWWDSRKAKNKVPINVD